MATRRRGAAGLDDLKAKLGYTETPADEETTDSEAPESGVPEAGDEDEAGEGAAAATETAAAPQRAPAPAPKASAPSASPYDDEDYSQAVADAAPAQDFTAATVGPPVEVEGATRNLLPLIAATVAALAFGFILGAIGISNNTVRKFENAAMDDAQLMEGVVQAAADNLQALDNDLSVMAVNSRYVPEFEERLRRAYGENRPVLDAGSLSRVTSLFNRNDSLGRKLLNYTLETNHLALLVDRHIQMTAREAEEIQRVTAGGQDRNNYGIAFDFQQQLTDYQNYMQDAAANPFNPTGGTRVAWESDLTMVVEGEGNNQREFYRVKDGAGRDLEVGVYDLVVLSQDQLLPPASSETALSRYIARATQIKERIETIVATQADLLTELNNYASKPRFYTF